MNPTMPVLVSSYSQCQIEVCSGRSRSSRRTTLQWSAKYIERDHTWIGMDGGSWSRAERARILRWLTLTVERLSPRVVDQGETEWRDRSSAGVNPGGDQIRLGSAETPPFFQAGDQWWRTPPSWQDNRSVCSVTVRPNALISGVRSERVTIYTHSYMHIRNIYTHT